MIRLLCRYGFETCDLIEVQPPPGSTTRHPVASLEWAGNGPAKKCGKRANHPDLDAQRMLFWPGGPF
jgi:hypothetical protein